MAYIGNSPVIGNFQVCDAISVVNGQAAYTMQVSSANVTPESANHMLVSLNGVLQKPGSSFTISGSTITFASNLATGDVIDFIILLGNVLDLGVPSDATVTDAKANFVSTSSAAGLQIKGDGTTDGTLQLNCSQNSHGIKLASPAHSAGQSYTLKFPTGNVTADKFLKVASVSGSGTTGIGQLSFADAGGGVTLLSTTDTGSGDVTNIDVTSNIDSTYRKYMVEVHRLRPATDGNYLRLQLAQGGSIVTSSSYDWVRTHHYESQSSQDDDKGQGESHIRLSFGIGYNAAENLNNCRFFIINPSLTDLYTAVTSHAVAVTESDDFSSTETAGQLKSTTAVNGFRLSMSSGDIQANCIVKLYGLS